MSVRGRRGRSVALAAGALLLAPAGAQAATPTATTRGAVSITQSSATVTGTVDPNGRRTSYFFQLGTTKAYGVNTTEVSIGNGERAVAVSAPVTGLAPATTYHYRVIARFSGGVIRGGDRTFKTDRQPLGVSLAATPNPVRAGAATTLAGTLTGTGNAGRQVVLQSNPFPFSQGFLNAGNALVTDANGAFSFPVLSVPVATQFRVVLASRPEVVSPIVVVGARLHVSTRVKARRRSVRFSGRISPAVDGDKVVIQKFVRTRWLTIATTFAHHHAGGGYSTYTRRVRQRRGGRYRVWADPIGAYTGDLSRTVRIRRLPR